MTMKGPFSISELKSNNIRKSNGVSGIYLWGVKYQNRYIPLNVGKGKNVHERLFQHLSRWRGGEYRIPKWDVIMGKVKQKNPFTTDANLLYIPHGANQYSDFLSHKEIQKTIKNVLDNFFCVWLQIDNSKLLDEEDELATLVGKNRLISSHRKSDTRPSKIIQDFYDKLNLEGKKTSP